MPLSYPEFCAQTLWFEYMRISQLISEWDARRMLRKTLRQMKRDDVLPRPGSEWDGMMRGWYKAYLEEQNAA